MEEVSDSSSEEVQVVPSEEVRKEFGGFSCWHLVLSTVLDV